MTHTAEIFFDSEVRAVVAARSYSISDYHNQRVVIRHTDGSVFLFAYALLLEDPDDPRFLWVATLHHGVHVFHRDSCDEATQHQRVTRAKTGAQQADKDQAEAFRQYSKPSGLSDGDRLEILDRLNNPGRDLGDD